MFIHIGFQMLHQSLGPVVRMKTSEEELEFTSSQTLKGYLQYRICFQALYGKGRGGWCGNQYSLLLGDPDTLFKWVCILQLRFICAYQRRGKWTRKEHTN